MTDALGNPLDFILTGGQVNDITQAMDLLGDWQSGSVIGDKGYDADAFVPRIEHQGAVAVIPSRCHLKTLRAIDLHLYKERYLAECFFNKLKYYRRVFSRFEKKARNFLSFVHLSAALIWLR